MSSSIKSTDGKEKFEQLIQAETELVGIRRKNFKYMSGKQVSGIALSGGGIRSATFCLGVLQALSEKNHTTRLDYLSTVSGGSYIGGFFGALFVEPPARGGVSSKPGRPTFDKFRPLQSDLGLEAVRRLRDSGRYLTPSGTSDAFYGAAVVMRNWAAVQTVIGLTLLLAFWCVRLVDQVLCQACMISPSLLGLSWVASALVFGFGSAYWLTRRDWIPRSRLRRISTNLFFWAFVAGFVFLAFRVWQSPFWITPSLLTFFEFHCAMFMAIALVSYLLAETFWGAFRAGAPDTVQSSNRQILIAAEDGVRTKLSGWMANGLIWFLTLSGLTMLDWLGYGLLKGFELLYVAAGEATLSVASIVELLAKAWPVLVAIAPPLFSFIARQGMRRQEAEIAARATGTKPSDRSAAMLVVSGATVVALWIVLWSAASRYAFQETSPFWNATVEIGVVLLLVNLIQSLCFSFINLSSLSTFYAARLRRAYLGASSHGNDFTSVRQDDPEDTIRVEDYYGATIKAGCPLHIINVTVAETIAGTSNLVARDRKGKPMQLSPCGIVFEGATPGVFEAGDMKSGEELPLANWIAISGAAVSAAIGSGTSLGTSILATMANVRLGYWWRAKHADRARDMLWSGLKDTVQNHLFLELRGAFNGTRGDRWYLTDGGHFENTGVYPLLQRKVDYIVACDNGADPKYDMVDILRLVQRARIDLGARVTFLDDSGLMSKLGQDSPMQGIIGTFQELARTAARNAPGGPIATLADIEYRCGKKATLLLIKPRLTFNEPPELLAYHARSGGADFPQQTTGDQFFDEEQWEAYRRLGELCGERLFVEPASGHSGWLPAQFHA
jgi:hypothetical protein